VWFWFRDLIDCREAGFSTGPLSHQEIESWSRLCRVPVTPLEVKLLRQLDRAFRAQANKVQTTEAPPEIPRVATRPMTETLFDALFP
jgi:hypothetical protein